MAKRRLSATARNNPKKTESSALLTVRDVAVLDKFSEKTVRRAIAAGLLAVVRVGPGARLVRVDPAAHRAYRALQSG